MAATTTRRGLIGGAAATTVGTAAVAARPAPAATARRRERFADVVVIGAGLAGLTAARAIRRAGRSVVVLEARSRVGGRVHGVAIEGGETTEMGAQFIGPTQDRIAALARSVGVPTYLTYNTGDNVYLRSGLRSRYSTSGPLGPIPPDPTGVPDAAKAIAQLNDMASRVPVDSPQSASSAEEWDSQTFETWKQDNVTTENGRFLVDVAIRSVFSCEPRDVSLLFILFYIAAAGNEQNPGNLERLVNTANGAQESRFVGGSQRIPEEVARRLGGRVVLEAPARTITQGRGKVRVEADGIAVTAQRVIVAIPPPLAGRLEYDPPLPALRDQLTQRFPMGSVTKVVATYPRPFWRDDGLTGQAVGDLEPVEVTFDNSPRDGSPGALMGFIEAQQARRLDSATSAERRRAVLENFAAYFGDQARSATGYVEKTWDTDIWTRGCPVAFTPPGVLLDYGDQIRRPVGRIHWSGTETSTFWNGYMDGAVRSGERAATEVLALLTARTPRPPRPRRRRRSGRGGQPRFTG